MEQLKGELYTKPVLPIVSDPMHVDGDGDGLLDGKTQEYNGNKTAQLKKYLKNITPYCYCNTNVV